MVEILQKFNCILERVNSEKDEAYITLFDEEERELNAIFRNTKQLEEKNIFEQSSFVLYVKKEDGRVWIDIESPQPRIILLGSKTKEELEEARKKHPGYDIDFIDDQTLADIEYIDKHYPKDAD